MARIIFISGTDTGVGKTCVTGLLLAHLLSAGSDVRALKPFCSGERTDPALLADLQQGSLSLEAINPFYFPEPLSPWTAARKAGITVSADAVRNFIEAHARACELLLVEGAGGLLSPLGEGFNAADLVLELRAQPILVAANRLGLLNQVLLTVEALRIRGAVEPRLVIMEQAGTDVSQQTNIEDLKLLLPRVPLFRIPFLDAYRVDEKFFLSAAKTLNVELSALLRGIYEPR